MIRKVILENGKYVGKVRLDETKEISESDAEYIADNMHKFYIDVDGILVVNKTNLKPEINNTTIKKVREMDSNIAKSIYHIKPFLNNNYTLGNKYYRIINNAINGVPLNIIDKQQLIGLIEYGF